MKTVREILAEIDRIIRKEDTTFTTRHWLSHLSHFILSESEKCEHVFKGRFQIEPELSQTTYQCIKCGAVK